MTLAMVPKTSHPSQTNIASTSEIKTTRSQATQVGEWAEEDPTDNDTEQHH